MTLLAYNVEFISWKREMDASTVVSYSLRVNAHKQPTVCTFRRHTRLSARLFLTAQKTDQVAIKQHNA